MKRLMIAIWFTLLASALITFACTQSGDPADDGEPRIDTQPTAIDPGNFAQAVEPRPFTFPKDHGPHPEFQTEWWYYTGNLQTVEGRRFGYQLTFFRRALLPADELPQRSSFWAPGQVYMAHFALSDIAVNRFHAFERLARGAAGLAGAQHEPFRVWLEDWQVIETEAGMAQCAVAAQPCAVQLQAARDGVEVDLKLTDTTGPSLQGDQGLSRKGSDPGRASYYYSLTRLASAGVIRIDGQEDMVSGWSWMDHEWSTSALSVEQVGWDWFSIQLDGGGQLMVFQIRRLDGSIDPFSSGLWVQPDGETHALRSEAFEIAVEDTWRSPHSSARYPSRWRVSVPGANLDLQIRPYIADQELNMSYAYWEGAVRVDGEWNGTAVSGHGYIELTGYSGSMGGEF